MGTKTTERYDAVAAAPGLEGLSAALFFVTAILLALGTHAVVRRVPAGRGHRLLSWGAGMLALGSIWLAAGRGAFNLEFAGLVVRPSPGRWHSRSSTAPTALASSPWC